MGYVHVQTLLDGVSTDGEGTAVEAGDARSYTLYVYANSALDTGAGDTFTVDLQGSPDGTNWVDLSLGEEAPGTTPIQIDQGDVAQHGGAGAYVAEMSFQGHPAKELRAVVSNFNDFAGGDLAITAELVSVHG